MIDPKAQYIAIKQLADKIKTAETEAKQHLDMKAGERLSADHEGFHLGFVTMAKGKRTAKVHNDAAFLAYVKAHHPDEILVEERVNPAFQKKILDDAAKAGVLRDADGVVIDGIVSVVVGDPYPVVTKDAELDITIAALVERGALSVTGLRELEAGE